LLNIPVFVDAGVPEIVPVFVFIAAHDGRPLALKVSVSPFASRAVGVKV